MLGVHVNTVRAWTDQGRLPCLRISSRGDRRYAVADLRHFLDHARRRPAPAARQAIDEVALLREVAVLADGSDDHASLATALAKLLRRQLGYDRAWAVDSRGTVRRLLRDRAAVQHAPNRQLADQARARAKVVCAAPAGGRRAVALPLDRSGGTVLQLERPHPGPLAIAREGALLRSMAEVVLSIAAAKRLRQEAEDSRRGAELLLSISSQITAQHDLPRVLSELIDGAVELFDADRGAVLRKLPSGRVVADAEHNLPAQYRAAVEGAPSLPLIDEAYRTRTVVSATNYHLDPRSEPMRDALSASGINTVSVAPLVAEGELLGALALYHDRPYEWQLRDRALFEQLANQGAAALRIARTLERTEAWAAQLQSIQQLGVELNRLDDARQIGQVIVAQLSQLIDYHNVRVYRVEGEDVLPVAWRGNIGEYADEDGDQLRIKVGQGITGWVAEHGIAQNLDDAASDPRALTIPGTNDDLDESLLVAPMLHEDEVIGVLVLAKLGLNQFTDDDQRLLEIFAAIAAQAMTNADAAERLRRQSQTLARQVASQRELLRVTESVLSTLDRQALLDEIADRLATLMPVDNIGVDLYDERTGMLQPIFARGRHADLYLANVISDTRGVGGHVVRTGEPVLVHDQLADERVAHFPAIGPQPGALIVLPLRARDRTTGLLTIERLGADADFSQEEFELAKLFGGHVAIALQNADVHHAVEVRAQTDALTGLLNHGELIERLGGAVEQRQPFGLLMLDLDDFKGYNDHFGHQAGDALLQHLATALREACRESDEIFRYGGDEFAILLAGTSTGGALAVADKILESVRQTPYARRGRGSLTCSIGVATFPDDGDDQHLILRAADRACYVAKRAGGDGYATAAEGQSLAGEFLPPPPTPVDTPETTYPAA